ncbi:hypothetical protein DL89DRAFT_57335 [Linderina pennispora]|uniref:Uncharacterized protein n=1 Tax=Linderina pennispora TaxID=61395 RepID=A0A1Y1VS03_9FUNG|nr:uncharacterized protein DL89DRAFT_57335 [Linderina pennispora]ORX64047.1 hypothetical protein DL89DRAFT_57335 [Linderina pennispora]
MASPTRPTQHVRSTIYPAWLCALECSVFSEQILFWYIIIPNHDISRNITLYTSLWSQAVASLRVSWLILGQEGATLMDAMH